MDKEMKKIIIIFVFFIFIFFTAKSNAANVIVGGRLYQVASSARITLENGIIADIYNNGENIVFNLFSPTPVIGYSLYIYTTYPIEIRGFSHYDTWLPLWNSNAPAAVKKVENFFGLSQNCGAEPPPLFCASALRQRVWMRPRIRRPVNVLFYHAGLFAVKFNNQTANMGELNFATPGGNNFILKIDAYQLK